MEIESHGRCKMCRSSADTFTSFGSRQKVARQCQVKGCLRHGFPDISCEVPLGVSMCFNSSDCAKIDALRCELHHILSHVCDPWQKIWQNIGEEIAAICSNSSWTWPRHHSYHRTEDIVLGQCESKGCQRLGDQCNHRDLHGASTWTVLQTISRTHLSYFVVPL